ncbi:hypothetical protein Y032_0309g2064 [Ancylostoma ceylanicum]|uniref:Cap-specific mRNA (nucleoside-2'-O-)-methyltransferase 2 n=1 Tax=Ancylostoma ceylanicum TaxID=53326 RepID=A0A016S3I6_9BILA|nr:hypothetical protein Y032_0309g2064 [Ancylostoma ceylanicum]
MDDEERILLDPSLSIDREYCLRHEGVWSEGTDTEPISLKNVQHKINGLKDQINRVCTKDDDGLRRWRLHTQNTHPLSMAPKLLRDQYNCPGTSQAYCKFLEILRRYRLVNPRLGQLHSIHLCEAPGHFVSSLDRFLCTFYPKKEWFWQANSNSDSSYHVLRCDISASTVSIDYGGPSPALKSTLRDRAVQAGILSEARNYAVFLILNSPLRQRFHRERGGRAACVSRVLRHRRLLQIFKSSSEIRPHNFRRPIPLTVVSAFSTYTWGSH